MGEPIEPQGEGAGSLTEQLRAQARRRGSAVALRYKQRGLWRSKSWSELEKEVRGLASGLSARGFVAGDRLLLDAPAVPETVSLSLAALWLGGALVVHEGAPLEGTPSHEAEPIVINGVARFVLVGDEAGRARLVASPAALKLGVVLDRDAVLNDDPTWISFATLSATHPPGLAASASADRTSPAAAPRARAPAASTPPASAAHQALPALIRWRAATSGQRDSASLSVSLQSHDSLLQSARALAGRGGRGTSFDALAGRELALGDRLEHVLPAWLVSGFSWSFVERAATEDVDRRELGPSLVFGSARDYAGLTERIMAALPSHERGAGRWLHAALDCRAGAGRWARRLLTARLREVTGLGRAQQLVAVGDVARVAAGFERLFGLPLVAWPERTTLASYDDALATAPSAARSSRRRIGFDPEELGATPRSDVG